jgi:hypothetical protein
MKLLRCRGRGQVGNGAFCAVASHQLLLLCLCLSPLALPAYAFTTISRTCSVGVNDNSNGGRSLPPAPSPFFLSPVLISWSCSLFLWMSQAPRPGHLPPSMDAPGPAAARMRLSQLDRNPNFSLCPASIFSCRRGRRTRWPRPPSTANAGTQS